MRKAKNPSVELIDLRNCQQAWNARPRRSRNCGPMIVLLHFDSCLTSFLVLFQLPQCMQSFTSRHYGNISIIHFLWALERMHNCIRKCSWSSIIPQTRTITKRNSNGIAACIVNSENCTDEQKRFEILIWFRWSSENENETEEKGEKLQSSSRLIAVWPHGRVEEIFAARAAE